MAAQKASRIGSILFVGMLVLATPQSVSSATKKDKLPPSAIPCQSIPGGRLAVNTGCAVTVAAEESENPTGLVIEAREEYLIIYPPKQQWFDTKSYPNTPPCGDEANGKSNLREKFSFLKKVRSAMFFSLIAEIDGDKNPYDLCGLKRDETSSDLKARASGSLILYANDARFFYWNNSGSIQVEIYRKL